jgi:hypothetical protein
MFIHTSSSILTESDVFLPVATHGHIPSVPRGHKIDFPSEVLVLKFEAVKHDLKPIMVRLLQQCAVFFSNYTVHRGHSQRTHTHPYEYTHTNPTP